VKIGDSDLSQFDRFISPTEFVAQDMGRFRHNRVGNRKDNVSIVRHVQQFIGRTTEVHGRDVDIGNGCDAQHLSSALRARFGNEARDVTLCQSTFTGLR
jgi:hypothetical protein